MNPPDPTRSDAEEPDIHRLLFASRPAPNGSLDPRKAFANLQTPEDKANFWKIIGLLAGAVAAWFTLSAILAIFPWWLIVLAVAGLAGYVWFRSWKIAERQWRIDAGFCGQCGYDLRGSPTVCPECGRDARLDEPTWRKLKREHAERANMLEKMTRPAMANVAPKAVIPVDAPAKIKPVFRPPVDLAPIPVEGDE
jgi:hypothetical protein